MPYKDPEKQKEAQRRHYLKNKKSYNASWRKSQNKKRELLTKAKEVPCKDCNIQYPYYVMQFDHVYGDKLFNLGGATYKDHSFEKVLAEIAKCEVVCANCHAERTYQRLSSVIEEVNK